MYLASAYPNSALSALTLMVIGFVMAGALAVCIGLVFLADRKPDKPDEANPGRGGVDEPAASANRRRVRPAG